MTVSPLTPTASRKLRLLNVTASIDPAAGGVSESILRMSKAVIGLGHEVEIVSADDPASPWRDSLQIPVHMKGPPRGSLEASPEVDAWLMANAARFDAIITHGLWRDNSRITRVAARAAGRPYFVFPHGMLDPWFKRYYPMKHLKKSVFWWLREYAVLRDARAVLFTCEEEMLLARETFWPYSCTERVVPLGTGEPPVNNADQLAAFATAFPHLQDKRIILFLGRLHEKKGCDLPCCALFSRSPASRSRREACGQDLHRHDGRSVHATGLLEIAPADCRSSARSFRRTACPFRG